jgi:hypothetical protein
MDVRVCAPSQVEFEQLVKQAKNFVSRLLSLLRESVVSRKVFISAEMFPNLVGLPRMIISLLSSVDVLTIGRARISS